jgi:hypothetical protein
MKSRTLVAFLIVWGCSLLLATRLSASAGQASGGSNLLQNPGFEEGKKGWSKSPSAAIFVVTKTSKYVHSGTWAASLNRTDGVPGKIYIYQDVEGIIGGMPYALSGWAYKDSPKFGSVYLEIQWWDSLGEIDSDSSHILTEDEDAYRRLCIPRECNGDGVQAPNNAIKARIKCMADIQEPNPEAPVFFDDLSFTFQGSRAYLPLVVKKYNGP